MNKSRVFSGTLVPIREHGTIHVGIMTKKGRIVPIYSKPSGSHVPTNLLHKFLWETFRVSGKMVLVDGTCCLEVARLEVDDGPHFIDEIEVDEGLQPLQEGMLGFQSAYV